MHTVYRTLLEGRATELEWKMICPKCGSPTRYLPDEGRYHYIKECAKCGFKTSTVNGERYDYCRCECDQWFKSPVKTCFKCKRPLTPTPETTKGMGEDDNTYRHYECTHCGYLQWEAEDVMPVVIQDCPHRREAIMAEIERDIDLPPAAGLDVIYNGRRLAVNKFVVKQIADKRIAIFEIEACMPGGRWNKWVAAQDAVLNPTPAWWKYTITLLLGAAIVMLIELLCQSGMILAPF